MEAYKLEDLVVLDDSVAVIRHRPSMYMPSDTPGPYLAGKMVQDIALQNALPVRVTRHGGWWLVSSERDWLQTTSGVVSTEPFFRIVPCPQWGRYAFRTEVLLTAFAEAVVTAADRSLTWLAGEGRATQLPAALRAVMDAAGPGRHVAFHMAPDARTGLP